MLQIPKSLALDFYSRALEGKVCRPVKLEDCASIPGLVEQMAQFCRDQDGIGLAAPQVGIYVRLAIVMVRHKLVDVLINPEIVNLAGRDLLEDESCLSLPEAKARVWRSEIVHIANGTLDNPQAREITIHRGTEARVIQHEIDHLDGVFFINRCGPVARSLALAKFTKHTHRMKKGREQIGAI
jgi:peptide deformylase